MALVAKPELYKGKIKKIVKAREFQMLYLECDRPVEFTAGQFLTITLPCGEKRAYSIASAPVKDNSLELLVGNVVIGKGTQFLCSLQEDDTLEFLAPFGLFGFKEEGQDETIFIGTGAGIAPHRSVILDQLYKGYGGDLYLLWGSRYEENLIYDAGLKKLAQNFQNFTYDNILSRPSGQWTGKKGYVTDLLKEINLKDEKKRLFFLCGRQEMIEDVKNYLLDQGIAKQQIRFESFG